MRDLNGIDLATKIDRKRISREFNDLFAGLSDARYAKKLNVSKRTARGLRTKDRAPQKATAQLMLDNVIRIRTLAEKNDAELVIWAEEIRRENEKKQLQIAIEYVRKEGLCDNIPRWFGRAGLALEERKYEVVAAILEDHLAPEESSGIDPTLKALALNRLGLAMYYLGRVGEAIEHYESAVRTGLEAKLPGEHIALFRTNLAGALVRKHEPEMALEQCLAAIENHIAHLPAYYIALCSSDALCDSHLMAIWIGRTIQVGKSEVPSNHLQNFVDRAEKDPDLAWARHRSGWAEFIQTLQALIASKTKL